jgi:hypothetical protein
MKVPLLILGNLTEYTCSFLIELHSPTSWSYTSSIKPSMKMVHSYLRSIFSYSKNAHSLIPLIIFHNSLSFLSKSLIFRLVSLYLVTPFSNKS